MELLALALDTLRHDNDVVPPAFPRTTASAERAREPLAQHRAR
jgi:hypothetical protein